METVRVLNLATGKEQFYTCSPEKAVVAAYEQSRGNWNTWMYPEPDNHPKFSRGIAIATCGNFTAFRN